MVRLDVPRWFFGGVVADVPARRAAWQRLRTTAADDELVCITGSFFLAAELRPQFLAAATNNKHVVDPQAICHGEMR